MTSRSVSLLCGFFGLVLLFYPEKTEVKPVPVVKDNVSMAFDTYENLWRKHAVDTADKIQAGDLKTEKEIWDYLASGQAPARKIAFEDLAKAEQAYFDKKGGWSAAKHETLLRSYVK